MKKILYGICGIGNGHTQRQLPLIEYFSVSSQIVIFAYDSSFEFYKEHFKNNRNVSVLNVAVPFYVGNKDGIDFEATEKLEKNKKDYAAINGQAVAKAEEVMGVPSLVISDYEPISAEYAYKHHAPLITIDQQSKYLTGEFPKELHGETYADEIARLKMFFPTATVRIACSFFDVAKKKDGEEVLMVPPILKESILSIQNVPTNPTSILVYFSSQKEFPQTLDEVVGICSIQPEVQFHIFAPHIEVKEISKNVSFYKHGDKRFTEVLKNCSGIISTAGHTLLSEAMHLGIPVYAIPLTVYEQQMNAEVIDKGKFGIKSDTIHKDKLEYFVSNLSIFRSKIKDDRGILLKGNGKEIIIKYIESNYLSSNWNF